MSYNCDRRNNRDEDEQQMADQNETSTKILQLVEDFFDFIILDISQLTPPHLVDLNPRLSILHIPNLGKQSHLIQSPHQYLRLTPSGHIKRHIKGNTSNPPVGHLGLPEVQQTAPSKYVQHRYQPKRQK